MKLLKYLFILNILFFCFFIANAQTDTTVCHLTLEEQMVNKTGKEVTGMTINGTIPGPTLRFKDYAENTFTLGHLLNNITRNELLKLYYSADCNESIGLITGKDIIAL